MPVSCHTNDWTESGGESLSHIDEFDGPSDSPHRGRAVGQVGRIHTAAVNEGRSEN